MHPHGGHAPRPRAALFRSVSPVRQPDRFLERQQARRLAAFIRSDFPRADQVFAYQHLQGLALRLDAEFCVFYEEPIDPGGMGADIKAWFDRGFLSPCSPQQQAADLDHFRQTCPDRVATVLGHVAAALGCEHDAVLAIPAAASAWSRARWTKAYAPDLLASFYTSEDALAAYLTCALLDIPRLLFLSELGDGATHYLAKLLQIGRASCRERV